MSQSVYLKQAVIFAGGRGERLRPLTDHLPKPMAPVNDVPFLDYLLKSLVDAGIKKILFLLGYRAETIVERYKESLPGGIKVEYSIGTAEDLTGRRLLNAYAQLDDKFLLLYGDNFWPLPLADMEEHYHRLGLPVTTTVFSNRGGTGEYGFENNVIVSPDHKVKAYDKSRRTQGLNGVDIGFFLIDKKVIDPDIQGNISFEEVILSQLAAQGRLGAFVTDKQYYYITNIGNLKDFERVAQQEGFVPINLEAVQ